MTEGGVESGMFGGVQNPAWLHPLKGQLVLPDGIQHNELDLSAISQDAHHGLGYLVHGAAGSRAAVVVCRAHRQHNATVARLE